MVNHVKNGKIKFKIEINFVKNKRLKWKLRLLIDYKRID